MEEQTRRKRRSKAADVLLLLIVAVLLVFGIRLVAGQVRRQQALEAGAAGTPVFTEPSETAAPEMIESVPADTPESTEISEPETQPETQSQLVSENGSMRLNQAHMYVRINHEQKIPFRLAAGVHLSDITYTMEDNDTADVQDGVVTGLQKGDCIITAHYGTETLQIPVTVRELMVEDNCTYVDGILIVNKSYGLPREYDPGMLPVTAEAFAQLKADASVEGLNIYEGSGYRNYDFQVKVYNSIVSGYSKEYADTVSARPGYSEHQTGYTIDCNTINDAFGETDEGKWLAENCYKYGFIIRYPEGKEDITGYAYESWHIRYVGVEHAAAIYEQGLTLEEYLDVDSAYE